MCIDRGLTEWGIMGSFIYFVCCTIDLSLIVLFYFMYLFIGLDNNAKHSIGFDIVLGI